MNFWDKTEDFREISHLLWASSLGTTKPWTHTEFSSEQIWKKNKRNEKKNH